MPSEVPAPLRRQAIDMLAVHESGDADPARFVEWAVQAMVAGLDSPALCALAGLDLDGPPQLMDAVPLLRQATAELGIALPSGEALLRLFAGLKVRDIADGADVHQALERIHRYVIGPLDHPPDLYHWCLLATNLHPVGYAELEPAQVEAVARDYARQEVTQLGANAPA